MQQSVKELLHYCHFPSSCWVFLSSYVVIKYKSIGEKTDLKLNFESP